jgi:branched-chain amino acid transport system permease protein
MLVDLVQNTVDGVLLGSAYALLALGFTFIFGVLGRANLAYGPAVMLGVYAATWVHLRFRAGFLVLALVTISGTVLAGAYVERLCFAPRRRRGPVARDAAAIASMVGSFALWMQLEAVATLVLPKHLYGFPALPGGAPVAVGPFTLRVEYVVMLASTAAVCVALHQVLGRTRFGLAVRAVVDNVDAARCVGIDVPRVSRRVFALASALGGLAGYLIVAAHGQATPMLGMWSTLKGMIAMMLGGLGSLPGAVLGGLALGLLEAWSQWLLGPQYRDLIAYLVLFALLAARPAGRGV